jgi:hypothetical protein
MAKNMRFVFKDVGNGEWLIMANSSGKMMRMSNQAKLEVSDKLQPTYEERFVIEFSRPWWETEVDEIEPWANIRCRAPRNPMPEVVPFYVTSGSNTPTGPPPPQAQLFEYLPAPALVEVSPVLVPHGFTRAQPVTVHLRALEGYNDRSAFPAAPHNPSWSDALAGGLVELRGKVSGLYLCLEKLTPPDACTTSTTTTTMTSTSTSGNSSNTSSSHSSSSTASSNSSSSSTTRASSNRTSSSTTSSSSGATNLS